jgi:hypothetical protein
MDTLMAEYPITFLVVAGQLGMVAHWLKRWAKEETPLGPIEFFEVHRKAAFGSMLVLASVIVGMVAADMVVAGAKAMAAAFLAGFNLNSIFTPHDEKSGSNG